MITRKSACSTLETFNQRLNAEFEFLTPKSKTRHILDMVLVEMPFDLADGDQEFTHRTEIKNSSIRGRVNLQIYQ